MRPVAEVTGHACPIGVTLEEQSRSSDSTNAHPLSPSNSSPIAIICAEYLESYIAEHQR